MLALFSKQKTPNSCIIFRSSWLKKLVVCGLLSFHMPERPNGHETCWGGNSMGLQGRIVAVVEAPTASGIFMHEEKVRMAIAMSMGVGVPDWKKWRVGRDVGSIQTGCVRCWSSGHGLYKRVVVGFACMIAVLGKQPLVWGLPVSHCTMVSMPSNGQSQSIYVVSRGQNKNYSIRVNCRPKF